MIEFITHAIHHRAFNMSRDTRTDTKEDSLSGCIWFDYISKAEEMEERDRKKKVDCTHYINKD